MEEKEQPKSMTSMNLHHPTSHGDNRSSPGTLPCPEGSPIEALGQTMSALGHKQLTST